MRLRNLIFVFFLCGASALAVFVPVSHQERSVEDLLAVAVENSEILRADLEDQKRATLLQDQAGLPQNPYVELTGGKIQGSEAAGPIQEYTLRQVVPFPGKLSARRRVAEADGKLVRAQGQQRRLEFEHRVVLLCYELAVLDRLSHHIQARKERVELIRRFLKSRPFVSPVQAVDRDLIEHKLLLLEKMLVELGNERTQTWNALNFHLRFPRPVLPKVHWWKEPKLPQPDSLLAPVRQDNPELIQQSIHLGKAEADLDQGRYSFLPDFNLGVGYRKEGTGVDATQFFSGYLTVSLPLIDHGQNTLPALRAARESSRLRLEHQRRMAEQTLTARLENLKKFRQTLDLYPLSRLAESEAAFDRADAEFRRGRLPINSYLEMETQTHDTQDLIFQTQLGYTRALSQLLLHAGQAMEVRGESDARQND